MTANSIIEEHYVFARKISEHYCNLIGLGFTEDVHAEGLVGLVKAANSYLPSKLSFKSWAAFKIRCEIREWIKSQFRGQKGDARRQAIIFPLEDWSSELTIDGLEDAVCTKDQICKLLERIPVTWASVIRLHYMEGMSFKKIGDKNGYTRNNASAIHIRALKRMRSEYEKENS